MSKPLRSLLRLRASLRWRGSLLLSLSPSLSLWPTDCHTDCTGRDLCPHVTSLTRTSRHADRNAISFIKTGRLQTDYMHIAILFREQGDTQLQLKPANMVMAAH